MYVAGGKAINTDDNREGVDLDSQMQKAFSCPAYVDSMCEKMWTFSLYLHFPLQMNCSTYTSVVLDSPIITVETVATGATHRECCIHTQYRNTSTSTHISLSLYLVINGQGLQIIQGSCVCKYIQCVKANGYFPHHSLSSSILQKYAWCTYMYIYRCLSFHSFCKVQV